MQSVAASKYFSRHTDLIPSAGAAPVLARDDGDRSLSMTETAADPAAQGSPFWRFSNAFYRRAGVAQACLDLQDNCDVDVNLLLFLLWLADAGRRLAAGEVRTLDERLRRWRGEVVSPLRAMRRMLKSDAPLVEPGQAGFFRSRVKSLELEAERLQQEAMFAMAEGIAGDRAASRHEAARANVEAYQDIKGHAFSQESVKVLLAAFARP